MWAVGSVTSEQHYERGRERLLDNLRYHGKKANKASKPELKVLLESLNTTREILEADGPAFNMKSRLVNLLRHMTKGHRRTNPDRDEYAGLTPDAGLVERGHFAALFQARLLSYLGRQDPHPLKRNKSLFQFVTLPSAQTLKATLVVCFLFCF